MSDNAHMQKPLSERLYEAGMNCLRSLRNAGLVLLVAALAAGAVLLFAPEAVKISRSAGELERQAPRVVVQVREIEYPIKCLRPTGTLMNAVYFGSFPKQRVDGEDGKSYQVIEKIKRQEGERYPCTDSGFDAFYVEVLLTPPATAKKE